MLRPGLKLVLAWGLAVASQPAACQSFHYVEPGLASCPTAPVATTAPPKTVAPGVALSGRIVVACGFEQGSYTVTLNASDPGARFDPPSFIVNFGRIAGAGGFAVRFSTVGVQRVWPTISANMGSPLVRGHFASAANEFRVVPP